MIAVGRSTPGPNAGTGKAPLVLLALAANAAVAVGLVHVDEVLGTAHLSPTHILAPGADASAEAPDSVANRVPGATPSFAPTPFAASGASPAPAPSDRRFIIRRILPITGPIKYGESHWDETGVPPGPLVITVDLEARVLSVFRDGYEIGTTAVLLGTQEKPTPLGMFPITQKDANHVSNLYDAKMPYMQRLTDDGVTIHATTVENGYASHGCIGVPMDFARKLFGKTHLGDRVYITRGKQVGIGDSLVDQ